MRVHTEHLVNLGLAQGSLTIRREPSHVSNATHTARRALIAYQTAQRRRARLTFTAYALAGLALVILTRL